MNINEEGKEYIQAIFDKFSIKTGLGKVKLTITNYTKDSVVGVDPFMSGAPQLTIHAVITKTVLNQTTGKLEKSTGDLFHMGISELPSCGLAVVSELTVGGITKRYYPESLSALKSFNYMPLRKLFDDIFGIFTIREMASHPITRNEAGYLRPARSIISSRYSPPFSLIFAGNDYEAENKIYEKVGFIKTVPYYNTRYEVRSRFIYVYDSRKNINDRKNISFDKAITISTARKELIKVDRPDTKSVEPIQESRTVSAEPKPDVKPDGSNVRRERVVQNTNRYKVLSFWSSGDRGRSDRIRKQKRYNGMVRANQRR